MLIRDLELTLAYASEVVLYRGNGGARDLHSFIEWLGDKPLGNAIRAQPLLASAFEYMLGGDRAELESAVHRLEAQLSDFAADFQLISGLYKAIVPSDRPDEGSDD